MADLATINNIYNHFLTAYAPQGSNTKYDTHKKSELRGVYNSIVAKTKDTPLFLFDNSPSTTEFAVGLKEDARSLKNTISSLSLDDSDSMLDQKSVTSSDENVVSASYIGSAALDSDSIPTLDFTVEHLATGQINEGKYLSPDKMDLPTGTYSFDIHSRDMDYEFQFNIEENDTNNSIQEKLARLICKSNIGVNASVDTDSAGKTALVIKSDDTGIRDGQSTLFDVSDDKTSKTAGTVEYFGIGDVTTYPSNSEFTLNGESRSTFSNHFSIEKTFDINLNGLSEEGSNVTVGLKTDIESITENINNLIDGYNSFINKLNAYSEVQPYSKKLVNEMNSIARAFSGDLESVGLNFSDEGTISLDRNLLAQTADNDDAMDRFSSIEKFASSLLSKVNQVSLDPMEYAQKKVVAYKNPGKNFASPYVSSNYSGMLFSSYC